MRKDNAKGDEILASSTMLDKAGCLRIEMQNLLLQRMVMATAILMVAFSSLARIFWGEC